MKHLLLILLVGYLGLHNGQLALFNGAQADLQALLPYRAETFSATEQEALKQGIPYHSDTELQQLLEDFLS